MNALAPDAALEYERIREFPPAREIADRIERTARNHDPSVLFLGSENVDRVVTPSTSVAANIDAAETYDVHIVRHPSPPKLAEIDPHPDFCGQDAVDR